MIFDAFISDPHFNHRNIIQYSGRPFSSVEDMNAQMIARYNARIGHNDRVLWLGDCFFSKNRFAKDIMSQLNGKKYLILGNHDALPYDMVERGFEFVTDRIHTKISGRNVLFIHYDTWQLRSPWDNRYMDRRYHLDMDSMQIIVHGHTHQKLKRLLNQVHVGVDSWDYAPAMYDEVVSLIEEIPGDWNRDLRAEYQKLLDYRQAITVYHQLKSTGSAHLEQAKQTILDSRFDCFRGLCWEHKT